MRSHNECSSQHFWGVGFIALLNAARCNCSLNNHLSGVVRPDIHHRPAQCSLPLEASPTHTVAFHCLRGQFHQPLHQGWLLETFLSLSDISTWYEADLCPLHLLRQGNKQSLSAVEIGKFNLAKEQDKNTYLQTSPDNHTQIIQIYQTMVSHKSCSVLSLSIGSSCQQLHIK